MMLYLIVTANKYRKQGTNGEWAFPLYIEVGNTDLMRTLQVSRVETLAKIRDELIAAGYLHIVHGIGKHPTAYVLLLLHPAERCRMAESKTEAEKVERFIAWSRDRGMA